jgi:hypothetical protein
MTILQPLGTSHSASKRLRHAYRRHRTFREGSRWDRTSSGNGCNYLSHKQFFVRHAAPQEVRKPRGQLEIDGQQIANRIVVFDAVQALDGVVFKGLCASKKPTIE